MSSSRLAILFIVFSSVLLLVSSTPIEESATRNIPWEKCSTIQCRPGQACLIDEKDVPRCVQGSGSTGNPWEKCSTIQCRPGQACLIDEHDMPKCVEGGGSTGNPWEKCSHIQCAIGEACRIDDNGNAQCIHNSTQKPDCSNSVCAFGWKCQIVNDKPVCVATSCDSVACQDGYYCSLINNVPMCLAKPTSPPSSCSNTVCAPDFHCVLVGGVPKCILTNPPLTCANKICSPGYHCVAINGVPQCIITTTSGTTTPLPSQKFTVMGYAWRDWNANGIENVEDYLLPGKAIVTVGGPNGQIIQEFDIIPQKGGFRTELPAGHYCLRFVMDDPTLHATKFGGDNSVDQTGVRCFDLHKDINILAGFIDRNQQSFSVSGFLWDDLNGDGYSQLGEIHLPGTAILTKDGQEIQRTNVTSANGYKFTGLAPGFYCVELSTDYVGMMPGARGASSIDSEGISCFEISDRCIFIDGAFVHSKGGHVQALQVKVQSFSDSFIPIPSIGTIRENQCSGKVIRTISVTAQSGATELLFPGRYCVVLITPEGYSGLMNSTANELDQNGCHCFNVTNSKVVVQAVFTSVTSCVTGHAFEDINQDNRHDNYEPFVGLFGSVEDQDHVRLANGTGDFVTSSSVGSRQTFRICGLSPNAFYCVQYYIPMPGYQVTSPEVDNNGRQCWIQAVGGTDLNPIGFRRVPQPRKKFNSISK
eukprot:gene12282-14396_t